MKELIAACLLLAAQSYNLPPTALIGIYQVEGGQAGQEVGPNKNGSYDLGPMQINTIWLPQLAEMWGVSEKTARRWVRDDPCINMNISAWILRSHLNETGDLAAAIAQYHSRTPGYGNVYKKKVVSSIDRHGLLRTVDGR